MFRICLCVCGCSNASAAFIDNPSSLLDDEALFFLPENWPQHTMHIKLAIARYSFPRHNKTTLKSWFRICLASIKTQYMTKSKCMYITKNFKKNYRHENSRKHRKHAWGTPKEKHTVNRSSPLPHSVAAWGTMRHNSKLYQWCCKTICKFSKVIQTIKQILQKV